MKAGDVFYFINFKFKDGSTANKILIILNTPQDNEPYLVCLTTSVQKKWRTKELGCHLKIIIILWTPSKIILIQIHG